MNNVYFDTFDHFAYAENLSGASARSKVRFRWYGEGDEPEKGTLEVKRRRSSVGWKLSYRVGRVPLIGTPWLRFRRALRDQLPGEARIWLDANPQQVLINRYRRRYFLSRDGALRITLDRDQVMFDQLASNRPNTTRRLNLPGVHILELKCEDTEYDSAMRALANCPIRGSRFSKYTVGAELRD